MFNTVLSHSFTLDSFENHFQSSSPKKAISIIAISVFSAMLPCFPSHSWLPSVPLRPTPPRTSASATPRGPALGAAVLSAACGARARQVRRVARRVVLPSSYSAEEVAEVPSLPRLDGKNSNSWKQLMRDGRIIWWNIVCDCLIELISCSWIFMIHLWLYSTQWLKKRLQMVEVFFVILSCHVLKACASDLGSVALRLWQILQRCGKWLLSDPFGRADDPQLAMELRHAMVDLGPSFVSLGFTKVWGYCLGFYIGLLWLEWIYRFVLSSWVYICWSGNDFMA